MDIRVKITKPINQAFFEVPNGTVVNVDLDEYTSGVLAGEVYASWPEETLKAQAVAARTFAAAKAIQRADEPYDVDDTSSFQSFKAANFRNEYIYAAEATAGEILTYDGAPAMAKYCASNGGQTLYGSKPYLPAKNDPWDALSGKTKNGHGIGMSQWGAKEMGDAGKSYREILAFYYPGTKIEKIEGDDVGLLNEWLDYLEAQIGRGVYVYGAQGQKATEVGDVDAWIDRRSTSESTAKKAQKYYRQKAAEIGAENIRFFDCSGLAMYFFQNLKGISKNDASANTLWLGCKQIPKSDLKPGDFVFIDTDGRKTHIGYVARDLQVIEARASGYGVEVYPQQSRPWTHFGRHKWLRDEIEGNESTVQAPQRTVAQWQRLLLVYDPMCLPRYGADGDYGAETDAAMVALIKDAEAFREANK